MYNRFKQIIFFTFLLMIYSCNSGKVNIPKGFEKCNDSCFVQIISSSKNEREIKNDEKFIVKFSLTNEFDMEIPLQNVFKKIDTCTISSLINKKYLSYNFEKLNVGDTILFVMNAAYFLRSENLQSTIQLAPSQNIFFKIIIEELVIEKVFETQIETEKIEPIKEKPIDKKTAKAIEIKARIKPPTANVPANADNFEKEEFTLRYYLEYTKPEWSKNEVEPGFYFKLTKKGNGDFAKRGDFVTIDYVGRFLNGKKFDDSSLSPIPFEFELGKPDQLLKGIEKALYKMKEGSKATIYFSSRFGYGAEGSTTGIVEKYKSLTFAVHLKKIKKKNNEVN